MELLSFPYLCTAFQNGRRQVSAKSLSFTTKKYRFMTQKSLTFDECKQLSSRIIAMNPNRRANMGQISSHLLDYYTELTKQPWLAQLVGQIRDLTAQQNQMMQEEMKAGETYQQLDRKITDLKKQLPFRSPHYFHFLEDHRAQKFIDPEAFTFQTTVDIDNPEEVEPAVKNALLLNGMFDEPTEKLFREKSSQPKTSNSGRERCSTSSAQPATRLTSTSASR